MERIGDYTALLGEGSLWNHRTGELYWVDIEAKRFLILNPRTEKNRIIQLHQEIGTVVPTDDGQALVALEDGIYKIHLQTEALKLLVANPTVRQTRFNDGKCDPAGRFWLGTMDRKHKDPLAALYCLNNRIVLQQVVSGVVISNGIIWSLDKTRMYYIDTRTQKVVCYRYDLATGEINAPEDAIIIPPAMGRPDGCTIDEEGMLWIALWAGGAVTRWHPGTGELLARLEVPAWNVSSVAFGAPDLDTLYITTARSGMNRQQIARFPEAGCLFAAKPGVKGIPAFSFKTS